MLRHLSVIFAAKSQRNWIIAFHPDESVGMLGLRKNISHNLHGPGDIKQAVCNSH